MARLKPFRKIATTDTDMNRLQENLKEFLDALLKNPLLGANVLRAVPLTTGTQQVHHGLGRNYQSVFFGAPSAACSFSLGASVDPTQFVAVTASAPCSVDMLVT